MGRCGKIAGCTDAVNQGHIRQEVGIDAFVVDRGDHFVLARPDQHLMARPADHAGHRGAE